MTTKKVTHRAVEKALDILLCFVPNNREMGTLEISRIMGFDKSTTNRLLHVLSNKGFLRQNTLSKKFQLGPSAMALGVSIKRSLDTNIVQIAKPHMEYLRDILNESIGFEIFSGTNTILAHLLNGPHRINLAGNIGDILSVHAAAGAKAIVAFSSKEIQENVLRGPLPALTENTITEPKKLQKQFEEIRRNGFSFDNEEHDFGTNALGSPIFDYSGKPIAALVVVGPSQRVTSDPKSNMIRQLMDATKKISKQLYYKTDNTVDAE